VDGTSINFSEEKTYGYEQALSGELGDTAKSFAESIKSGQFTSSGTPSAPKTYTATQQVLFDKVLSGKETEADRKNMKEQGLTDADVNAYAASRPNTMALTDDQRTMYNSQVSAFRGNQVVKDYESQIGQVANTVASLNADSGPADIAAIF